MADTILSPTGLVQIEVGASDDTWGGKENDDKATINGWFADVGGVAVLKAANGGTGYGVTGEVNSYTPTLAFSTPGTSSFLYTKQYMSYQRDRSWLTLDFTIRFTPTVGTGSGQLQISIPVNAVSSDAALAASGPVGQLGSTFVGYSGSLSVAFSGQTALRLLYTAASGSGSNALGAAHVTSGQPHTVSGSIRFRVA